MSAAIPSFERAAIAQLVDRFYAAIRADALLAPVFEPVLKGRWPAHLARMVDFWCTACKIERSFRGDVYQKHMALPDMAPAHLARWLRLWRQHTEALFAPRQAAHLQDVAVGVARVMHLGWFGQLPSRDELQALIDSSGEPATA